MSAFENSPHVPALTHTFELLARSQETSWPYQDKVFALMTPTWSADDKHLTLSYSDSTPTAALDNKLADELTQAGHPVHAVQRIRKGDEVPANGEWLVSGGLLLSTPQGQLITFERTVTSPSGQVIAWPKALNNPMGRVDTLPSATCYKEGAEEISILQYKRDQAGQLQEISPVMFITGANKRTGISLESELQLQDKMVAALNAGNTALEMPLGNGIYMPAVHDARYNDKLTTVTVEHNGIVVDRFTAVAARSAGDRTIEMAIPLVLAPQNGIPELRYIAREPFGRAVKMATPEQMEAMHYGWAMGALSTVQDPQQQRDVNLGGILPILQRAVLGLEAVSEPNQVQVPKAWPESRVRDVLGL